MCIEKLKELYHQNNIRRIIVEKFSYSQNRPQYSATMDAILFPLDEEIIHLNEKPFHIHKGQAVIISRGTLLKFESVNNKLIEHINFFFKGDGLKSYQILEFKNVDPFLEILFSLYNEYEENFKIGPKAAILIKIFFQKLFKEEKRDHYERILITKAIDYMKENIDMKIRLKDIANYCETSENKISYLFFKYLNKRPIDYFIDLKIDLAVDLLCYQNFKIAEIAEQLGYTDPYYFSRIFKKRIGQSPQKYIKQRELK